MLIKIFSFVLNQKKLKKDVVNSTEDKSLLKMGLSEKIMNAIKSLVS